MPERRSLPRRRQGAPVPLSPRSRGQLLRDRDRRLHLGPLCEWRHLPISGQWALRLRVPTRLPGPQLRVRHRRMRVAALHEWRNVSRPRQRFPVFLSTRHGRNALRVELERVCFKPMSQRGNLRRRGKRV